MPNCCSIWKLLLLIAVNIVLSFSVRSTDDVYSPVVSFQYADSLSETSTRGTIGSPVVSFQFFESLGAVNAQAKSSFSVSYLYGLGVGSPIILVPPNSHTIRQGESTTFSVIADGQSPLSYQWMKDGVNISGQTTSSLTLKSAILSDSGRYSVLVYNDFGSTVSALAWINVYLPPIAPKPSLPTATSVGQGLDAFLRAAPRQPNSSQLVVYTGDGKLDPNKMTIVLTHGWTDNSDGWPKKMAATLIDQGFAPTANIVAWDWRQSAKMPGNSAASLTASGVRTLSEGAALGSALLTGLGGSGYRHKLHFVGHSLGTLLNCHAADFVHGDSPNSPGALLFGDKFLPGNTQMTMFDEAELAEAVETLYVSTEILFAHQSKIQPEASTALWSKVIPKNYSWIDNYISLVGLVHVEAANALLWRNEKLGIIDSHAYAIAWYSNSIVNGASSLMGNRWSFERQSSLSDAPARNSCYLQTINSDPLTLQLAKINPITATLVAYPTLQTFRLYSALAADGAAFVADRVISAANMAADGGNRVFDVYYDGIQYSGNFLESTVESFIPPSGQPVFLGTAESTPAYYIPFDASTKQAKWSFQFTVGPSSKIQPFGRLASSSLSNSVSNSHYVLLPIGIPEGVTGMSFEFRLAHAGPNEYMTMGISNQVYFTIESEFVQNDVWTGTTIMNVSSYVGQQVQLFFSQNAEADAPTGELSVRGIQFYGVVPLLNIDIRGSNAVVSWPNAMAAWNLECSDQVSSTKAWSLLTNVPSVGPYGASVTNEIGNVNTFFRLRK